MIAEIKANLQLMMVFRSKLTKALLLFFFINPFAEVYLHELAKILNVKAQNLHRELKKFEIMGAFKSRVRAKKRYYSINEDWPLLRDYRNIIRKTIGLPSTIAENLAHVRYLRDVYVKNSEKLNENIELIVLQGLPSQLAIMKAIKPLEKSFERKIRVSFVEKEPRGNEYVKVL